MRLCLWVCCAVGLVLSASGCSTWEPVLVEDFSSPEALKAWRLDGVADLSIEREGDTDFMRIVTQPYPGKKRGQSTLWHADPVDGESLRFVFRMRGDKKNRSLFFFNARPLREGDGTIFDWPRDDAQYRQYAGCDRMGLYSVGILRYDQDVCNLRHLGGPGGAGAHNLLYEKTADGKPAFAGNFQDFFAGASVFGSFPSPFVAKEPNSWFECDLRVERGRVTFLVDGQQFLSVQDPGHGERTEYIWEPQTDGGWFAFRNFLTNTVDVDYLRVYRKR